MVDLTADALDELDAEKLTAAQSEMLLGSEAVQRATEALNGVDEGSVPPAPTNTRPPPTNTVAPIIVATATNPPPPVATDPPPPAPTEEPPTPAPVGNCININTAGFEERQQIIHNSC